MNLYYDNAKNKFTVKETATCEKVFETYKREERIGCSNGLNPSIKKGNIEIMITSTATTSSMMARSDLIS